MITVAQLIAAGVGPTQAKVFAAPLSDACSKFGLESPARIAGLLGQCMVESTQMTALEESLFYSDPQRTANIFKTAFHGRASEAAPYCKNPQKLANKVYGPRADLGNRGEASGDGWNYRGSGLIDITGLTLFLHASEAMGRDYVNNPGLVRQPIDACLTAAWYFTSRKCAPLADACAWDSITKLVNPPMLAAAERKEYSQRALDALTNH